MLEAFHHKYNKNFHQTNTYIKSCGWFRLTVGLGNTLKLILLLDGVRVRRSLAGVDELLSEALSNGLDVSERSFTSTNGQKSNGLVNSSKRRNIDGLSADSTRRSNSSRIFSGASVDDGINKNLERVLVGEQVDNLKSVLDNADSLKLLTVVAAVHHKRVGETLNNGALGLAETLGSVSASRVRKVNSSSDLDVVGERDILDLNIVERPFVEKLDGARLGDKIGGESCEAFVDKDFLLFFELFFDLLFDFNFNFDVRHFVGYYVADEIGGKCFLVEKGFH